MPTPSKLERDEVLAAEAENIGRAYIENYESVAGFYAGDYRSLDALKARARELAPLRPEGNALTARGPLLAKLRPYMKALGAPVASMDALARLGDHGVFAIVTGQQPGLCGGPALTLHKTAHAIRLAETMTAAGVPCVPVFWAASEDHDIGEVNRFAALDHHGKQHVVRLRKFAESGVAPLEKLTLPEADDPEIQRIAALCRHGPHGDAAADMAIACGGLSWGRAINTLMLRVFGDRGLVVLEPRLLRSMAAHRAVMVREISRPAGRQSDWDKPFVAVAKAGFREALPVMLPDESTYFTIRRNKRVPAPAVNAVPPHLRKQALEEALGEVAAQPEIFSPGVRLRPVVQGMCLPVLAYVAGPAEIAYHALLKDSFTYHGVPMPVLVPRWSMIAAPAGTTASQIASLRRECAEARLLAASAAAAIQEAGNEVRVAVDALRKELGPITPHVGGDLDSITQRAGKALGELKGRINAAPLAHREKSAALLPVAAQIEPANSPQERVMSWLGMWSTHGASLAAEYARRDPFDFSVGVVPPG